MAILKSMTVDTHRVAFLLKRKGVSCVFLFISCEQILKIDWKMSA